MICAAKRKVHLLGFCLDFGGGVGWPKLDLCWIDCGRACSAAFYFDLRAAWSAWRRSDGRAVERSQHG